MLKENASLKSWPGELTSLSRHLSQSYWMMLWNGRSRFPGIAGAGVLSLSLGVEAQQVML